MPLSGSDTWTELVSGHCIRVVAIGHRLHWESLNSPCFDWWSIDGLPNLTLQPGFGLPGNMRQFISFVVSRGPEMATDASCTRYSQCGNLLSSFTTRYLLMMVPVALVL